MPLIEGCSVEAAKKNMKKLLAEDRGESQAYAIALSKALENKNKCSKKRQRQLENGNLFPQQ